MMGAVVPLANHRHYRFPKVEIPQSFLEAMKVGLVSDPGKPRAFEFRRRKSGCEVWLKFTGGFSLNLTCHFDLALKDFSVGRAWAVTFAKQHGFAPMETHLSATRYKRKTSAAQGEGR